jgi:hypothetical protein
MYVAVRSFAAKPQLPRYAASLPQDSRKGVLLWEQYLKVV